MAYMIYSADDLDQVVDEDMIHQHRRYIESFGPRIRTGGPLLEEASGNPKGRVILIDLDTRADAALCFQRPILQDRPDQVIRD